MRVFLGRIDPSLTRSELEDYLSKFGNVVDLKTIEGSNYGFATFDEPFNSEDLLRTHEHYIQNKMFIVEKSKSREESRREGPRGDSYGRDRYDDYDRGYSRDRYDSRDRYYQYDRGYPSRDYPPYEGRRHDAYDRPQPRREPCSWCDKCPRHGSRPALLHGHLKVVCEGIDLDVSKHDLEAFARDHGFNPTFVTARGNTGYIELETVELKEEAVQALNGKELTKKDEQGNVIKSYPLIVKPYSEEAEEERSHKRVRTGEPVGAIGKRDRSAHRSDNEMAEEAHE